MLPRCFKPRVKVPLIRIGSKHDGGYVIPERALSTTEILYGFGVGNNWDFEEEFQLRNGALVKCFDHTLGTEFWCKEMLKDVLALCTLYRFPGVLGIQFARGSRWSPFRYWDYKKFFDGSKAIHYKTLIAPKTYGQLAPKPIATTDLDDLFAQHQSERCFLKIDIEGWEYRILDQLIRYQDRMTGLAIEFHYVDLQSERIIEFIEEFALQLIHVHGFNLGGDIGGDPTHLEMTFAPPAPDDQPQDDNVSYPIDGLDSPGIPGFAECILRFE